jgi:hypothetical protein
MDLLNQEGFVLRQEFVKDKNPENEVKALLLLDQHSESGASEAVTMANTRDGFILGFLCK